MPPSTITKIALIEQAMEFQKKEVAEIKQLLITFIDSAEQKFVTKEEHNKNKERIDALEKEKTSLMKEILKWLAIAIGGAVFSYVVMKVQWK